MRTVLVCMCALVAQCCQLAWSMTPAQHGLSVIEAYGRLPLAFEKNMGQAPFGVDFLARGSGYLIEMGPDAAIVRGTSGHATLRFLGTKPGLRGEGQQRLKGESNYLVGPNPALWRTQVRSFRQVVYRGLYPGIDLVYYGNNGQLEFDLVAEPGANLAKIQIAVEGTDQLRVDAEGGVVLHAGGEAIRLRAPLVYQDRAGARTNVRSRYVISDGNRIRFELGDYDSKRPLVIDPVLVYSTYLGGSRDDRPYGIAVDSSGCAYLIGETWSLDYPRINAVQPSERGDRDVFVSKVSADGASLVYSTYLGGKGYDSGRAIAVDASGAAYLTGFTWSPDFPVTSGVFRTTLSGQSDVFVAKLNSSGNGLVYSTYVGGAGTDIATSIALDLSGNAFVAGYTSSTDFPVTRAYQSTFRGGFNDAFVLEVSASGSGLWYSTYLGGSGNDIAQGLAVTSAGEAFVVGSTDSSDFPTANAIQPNNAGGLDIFAVKLSVLGSALAYSTYLGGSSSDMGTAIAIDSSGAAYITGATLSQNFPSTAGALRHTPDLSYDSFVAKITPDAHLAFAARFGGSNSEQGNAIAVDASGNTYVSGYTYSSNFPILSAVQASLGGSSDAFLTGLNQSGTAFLFSTYLGGAGDDQATGVAIDRAGNLYSTGFTLSGTFPTTAVALKRSLSGGADGFLTKLTGAAFSVPMQAINAGGPGVTTSGQAWLADTFYTGGGPYPYATYISNTADQVLYQTNRWGAFQYDIPVTPGSYDITLKFAEIAPVYPGGRVFTVTANGLTLLQHFDVVAAAGGLYRALDTTFPINVTGGTLQLKFIREIANPMVSAILISRRSTMAPVQINAGGPGVSDPETGPWLPDGGYTGGGGYSTTSPISGTSNPGIYQANRWGAFSYRFDVPNGSRTVTLKFAEIAPVSPGQRLFDVLINGVRMLQDFDVVLAAGGVNIAVDRSFPVNVTGQQVQIDFVPKRANAFVSAISVQ